MTLQDEVDRAMTPKQARLEEREAVVKWLRERAESVFKGGEPLWESGAHNNLHLACNAIERGDHLK